MTLRRSFGLSRAGCTPLLRYPTVTSFKNLPALRRYGVQFSGIRPHEPRAPPWQKDCPCNSSRFIGLHAIEWCVPSSTGRHLLTQSMNSFLRPSITSSGRFAAAAALLVSIGELSGQTQTNSAANTNSIAATANWTTPQDHRNMMDQLGITKLRSGRNGNANATNNPANYDPEKANPFPDWPDVLKLKNGQ